MRSADDLPIRVTATDRGSVDRLLDEAVAFARTTAMKERLRGVLVTRHNYSSFTVALSDEVPFGLTTEYEDFSK